MSDFPLLTESTEELGPIIGSILRAHKSLPPPGEIAAAITTAFEVIERSVYDHAVPRDEHGEENGHPSIHQVRAAFLALIYGGPSSSWDFLATSLADLYVVSADSQPGLTPREEYAREVFENFTIALRELRHLLGAEGYWEEEVPILNEAGLDVLPFSVRWPQESLGSDGESPDAATCEEK